MAVNGCERTVLTVAGEPVTFARQESAEAYESAIRAALDDPAVGSGPGHLRAADRASVGPGDPRDAAAVRLGTERTSLATKPVIAVMVGASGEQLAGRRARLPRRRGGPAGAQRRGAVRRLAARARPRSPCDLSGVAVRPAAVARPGSTPGPGPPGCSRASGPVIRQGGQDPRARLPGAGCSTIRCTGRSSWRASTTPSPRRSTTAPTGSLRSASSGCASECSASSPPWRSCCGDVRRPSSDTWPHLSTCISDVSALAVRSSRGHRGRCPSPRPAHRGERRVDVGGHHRSRYPRLPRAESRPPAACEVDTASAT